MTRNQNTSFRAGSNTYPLGARPKGSNGGVAVGLPHRNYSVLKQADPNKRQGKVRAPPSAVGGLEGSKKVVKNRNPG